MTGRPSCYLLLKSQMPVQMRLILDQSQDSGNQFTSPLWVAGATQLELWPAGSQGPWQRGTGAGSWSWKSNEGQLYGVRASGPIC